MFSGVPGSKISLEQNGDTFPLYPDNRDGLTGVATGLVVGASIVVPAFIDAMQNFDDSSKLRESAQALHSKLDLVKDMQESVDNPISDLCLDVLRSEPCPIPGDIDTGLRNQELYLQYDQMKEDPDIANVVFVAREGSVTAIRDHLSRASAKVTEQINSNISAQNELETPAFIDITLIFGGVCVAIITGAGSTVLSHRIRAWRNERKAHRDVDKELEDMLNASSMDE